MTAAFFDFDHTLISKSSGLLWYKYMREKGHTSTWSILKAAYAYLRYRQNSLDIKTLAEKEMKKVIGVREEAMKEMCQQWFDEMVKQYIYPRAVEVVNEHREQGHLLAILSAATVYAIGPVKRHLDIEHAICTHLVVQDGRFTGKLVEPYCYGEGKPYWAERFAEEHNLRLEDCYFYTDSYTDMPMLERVGMPRPVNPDKLLRAEAQKRGWPIINF
jgi:putative phosphoserine phosphatase/1-acylglycerol-3-phosphate O-acyltransferase